MTLKEYFDDPERPTFYRFGRIIDAYIVSKIGMGVLDIADQDYSSLHEDWDGTQEHAEQIAAEILADEFGFLAEED